MIKYDDAVPSVCVEVQLDTSGNAPSATIAAPATLLRQNQRVEIVMAILSEEFAE
jgi:hypothetical protein